MRSEKFRSRGEHDTEKHKWIAYLIVGIPNLPPLSLRQMKSEKDV